MHDAFDGLGLALRRMIANRQLRPVDLADRLDVAPTQVSRWLNERSSPDLATLSRILGALEYKLEDLARELRAVHGEAAAAAELPNLTDRVIKIEELLGLRSAEGVVAVVESALDRALGEERRPKRAPRRRGN